MKTKVLLSVVVLFVCAAGIGPGRLSGQTRKTPDPCVDKNASVPRLLPVDEAATRPDFFMFRARLQAAIASRDVGAMLEAIDPKIRLGFDASGGVEDFKKLTSGARADDFWKELGTVLALGGSFQTPSSFAAPFTYSRWPDDIDSFACGVVLGERVRLRAAPSQDAAPVGVISYSIVQMLETPDTDRWQRVRFLGRTGYVAREYVRRPIDFRALFTLSEGRWRMTAFVAGD